MTGIARRKQSVAAVIQENIRSRSMRDSTRGWRSLEPRVATPSEASPGRKRNPIGHLRLLEPRKAPPSGSAQGRTRKPIPGRRLLEPLAVFAFAALAIPALIATLAEPARAQSVQERLVGVYTLARFAGHGDEPTGRISYDAAGRMWAMVLPPGRSPYTNESTAEEVRDAVRGVIAYYGTYTIDESTGRVIHHLESASNPAWIGDDFVRWYRFDGPNLEISLNPDFENTLLWERLPNE